MINRNAKKHSCKAGKKSDVVRLGEKRKPKKIDSASYNRGSKYETGKERERRRVIKREKRERETDRQTETEKLADRKQTKVTQVVLTRNAEVSSLPHARPRN